MLTEEHNFDEALKNALGAGAVEKDVAELSQEDATPVNMLDSEGRQTYRQAGEPTAGTGRSYDHPKSGRSPATR